MSQMSPAISASYDLTPHPTPADLSEAKASSSMTNIASRNSILQSDLAFLRHELHSVTQLCLTLCDPKDCSTPGSSVLHSLPEFAQIHVHWVGDVIQPPHPLSPPSPPAFNLSQHLGLFQRVNSSHQVATVLELQHQSFQQTFRADFI